MKHAMVLVLLAVFAQGLLATDRHSNVGGGNWFDTTTWVGNMVPEPTDNVFIHGKVTATDVTCNNLTIYFGGELLNYRYGIYTVTVNGNLNNAGSISNNDMNYLSIAAIMNVTNTGYISAQYLYFSGTSSQYLSSSVNMSPANLIDTVSSSTVILQSDISLTNTSVNMNNGTLVLNGSNTYDLSMSGGNLTNATILGGNGATLTMGGNAYLQYVNANVVVLEGVVIIADGVSFGNLVNNATLYNYVSMAPTLNITQRLENHGTICNNPTMNVLYVNVGGDLYNYNTISNSSITISGASLHNVYQDATALPFTCGAFTVLSDSGNIQMLSDLRFLNCYLYLGGKTMLMFLDSNCYNLNIEGGYLYFAILDTNGFSTLDISAGAYLDYVTAEDIILRGTVIIVNNVVFDDVVVYGTVYNYQHGTYSMVCNGNLVNYGTIRNNPTMNLLYLYLGGDLYNYNMISTGLISFSGATQHSVFQDSAAQPFTGASFNLEYDSGNLQLLSDLTFSNCTIILNGKTILMYHNRSSYGLKIEGGYIYYGTLDTNGFSTLDTSAGAYLDYVTAEDVILRGTIIISNSVVFDDVVVYGTVYNYIYNNYNMICNGNLVNYGTIRDNPSMNYMNLYCRKDLTNYGTIQNQLTFIEGTTDQYILNGAGSSISCPAGFNLISDIGAAQWYFNGVINNPNYYVTLTVTPTELGVWQPFDGTNFGRNIFLGNGLPVSIPQNMTLLTNGTELKLQWDEVANAVYYTIYVSSDPYGTYLPLPAKVFDNDQTDGLVWMDIIPTQAFRFYKVAAGN